MDQDVTHCVTAPLEAAGPRPRYSLVWKLCLHPREFRAKNPMAWPVVPVEFGSANRGGSVGEATDQRRLVIGQAPSSPSTLGSRADLQALTIPELKERLRAASLPLKGRKFELVDRLLRCLAS